MPLNPRIFPLAQPLRIRRKMGLHIRVACLQSANANSMPRTFRKLPAISPGGRIKINPQSRAFIHGAGTLCLNLKRKTNFTGIKSAAIQGLCHHAIHPIRPDQSGKFQRLPLPKQDLPGIEIKLFDPLPGEIFGPRAQGTAEQAVIQIVAHRQIHARHLLHRVKGITRHEKPDYYGASQTNQG